MTATRLAGLLLAVLLGWSLMPQGPARERVRSAVPAAADYAQEKEAPFAAWEAAQASPVFRGLLFSGGISEESLLAFLKDRDCARLLSLPVRCGVFFRVPDWRFSGAAQWGFAGWYGIRLSPFGLPGELYGRRNGWAIRVIDCGVPEKIWFVMADGVLLASAGRSPDPLFAALDAMDGLAPSKYFAGE